MLMMAGEKGKAMNARFKTLITLRHKVTLYVPSTIETDQKVNNAVYVDKAAALFSEAFGGATSSPAVGYWSSPVAGLVKENTTIVFAFADEEALQNRLDDVVTFCDWLKEEMKQEAVALEVDGVMYLI